MVKKVVAFYNQEEPLFVGEEQDCLEWIFSQASEHIKVDDKIIYRVLNYPEGDVYDVGTLYQILDL